MKITTLTPQNEILREFGRRLGKERKRHGYTQEELASRAGIGIATLGRIEKGEQGQMGNWVKIQLALDNTSILDNFLPERINSPIEEAKKDRRSTRSLEEMNNNIYNTAKKLTKTFTLPELNSQKLRELQAMVEKIQRPNPQLLEKIQQLQSSQRELSQNFEAVIPKQIIKSAQATEKFEPSKKRNNKK